VTTFWSKRTAKDKASCLTAEMVLLDTTLVFSDEDFQLLILDVAVWRLHVRKFDFVFFCIIHMFEWSVNIK
jgi:hypothetical protein